MQVGMVEFQFEVAVAEVAERLGTSARWTKAAAKAAPKVLEWAASSSLPDVGEDGAVMVPGDHGVYTVREGVCTCPAGTHEAPCWHAAAEAMVRAVRSVQRTGF